MATPNRRRLEYLPLDEVKPAKRNPKLHDDASLDASLDRFGFTEPVLLDERTGRLVAGHGRLERLRQARDRGDAAPEGIQVLRDGTWKIPVIRGWASRDDAEAEAYLVASNRIVETGGWDLPELADLLGAVQSTDRGLEGVGYLDDDLDALLDSLRGPDDDLDGEPVPDRPTLNDRFLVPPFSVLDARQGYWLERKRQWLGLGFAGDDAGRAEKLTMAAASASDPSFYAKKRKVEATEGRELSTSEFLADYYEAPTGPASLANSGTSVFDPVLCEIAYRWFSPPDGRVLDPFAGGGVRGIVAGVLGRSYTGVDLSGAQLAQNRREAESLPVDLAAAPTWIEGDSRTIVPGLDSEFDLVFSCPPYADLEVYSDDPADLSTMKWADFVDAYREIIAASTARLVDDRFAVWVVGEVRASSGEYLGLIPETIAAFAAAGLSFYNEMILVTPVGSNPIRAGRQFSAGRKVGKTHQNVLVFVKGDSKRATEACGEVEVVADVASIFGEPLAPPEE